MGIISDLDINVSIEEMHVYILWGMLWRLGLKSAGEQPDTDDFKRKFRKLTNVYQNP